MEYLNDNLIVRLCRTLSAPKLMNGPVEYVIHVITMMSFIRILVIIIYSGLTKSFLEETCQKKKTSLESIDCFPNFLVIIRILDQDSWEILQ